MSIEIECEVEFDCHGHLVRVGDGFYVEGFKAYLGAMDVTKYLHQNDIELLKEKLCDELMSECEDWSKVPVDML